MTEEKQLDHFGNDLDKLIDRYRDEYDLTYASVIGILWMKLYDLREEADEDEEDDE